MGAVSGEGGDRSRPRTCLPIEALYSGRITSVGAGMLRARLPSAEIGQCVEIDRSGRPLMAELVGFSDEEALLLPLDAVDGLRPGASARASAVGHVAPCIEQALGRVIDGLGRCMRTGEQLPSGESLLRAAPPSALGRRPVERPVPTGLRVVDGMLPLGEGQRVGLFAGSGVGKSTLLAQLGRGIEADVVVMALVGERGREVGEFIEVLEASGLLDRTTLVVATADASPLLRRRAAEMATAIAEGWRSRGRHVLLLVDSLTRYARALREAALLRGEPPARRGYPASVFAELPRLLERAGQSEEGAITAIYTVLVDGGDMEEPVADEVRGLVDGHWVLRRELAERGHFPAVDVPSSVSRVFSRIASSDHREHASSVRRMLETLSQRREAIELGLYEYGTHPAVDAAIDAEEELLTFLRQGPEEWTDASCTLERLEALAELSHD
ncbi:MAG: FliI/YscN family ATPase [Deltaproteobacteria bacterium]|nr:MAG: FliI/YscN family ATPase [Deltaproteobacteria bacterium]